MLSRYILSAWLIGVAAAGASCGGSPSSSVTEEPTVYRATTPGLIRQVTFNDATSFTWRRATCVTRETGCTESGTYAFDDAHENVTFTIPKVAVVFGYGAGYSVTLPFAAGDSTETQSVHVQGLTSGSQGSLATGSTSLGSTFQMGEQSFSATSPSLVSTPDGGTALTVPVTSNWLPQVVNQQGSLVGGGVFTPTVITVTWSADSNAATYEKFDDALVGSAYWSATTAEYGVGNLTSGPANHVRLPGKPPTNLTTEKLATWLKQQMTAKLLPFPTATSYYALYLPSATSAHYTEQGQSGCDSFDGEHASATVNKTPFAYAILLHCSGSTLGDATASASHELVEGAADPFDTKPGYIGFDHDHLAWDLLQDWQDEIADACESFPNINTTLKANGATYQVQRTWSNAAAAEGHDPCVPAPAGPYFNISPQNMKTVTINTPSDYESPTGDDPPKTLSGLGYSIKVGATLKIPLNFLSDVDGTSWTISALEGAPSQADFTAPKSHSLTLSLDKTSGQNGTTANLTVKVKSSNATLGGELITITSTLKGTQHFAPILISNK